MGVLALITTSICCSITADVWYVRENFNGCFTVINLLTGVQNICIIIATMLICNQVFAPLNEVYQFSKKGILPSINYARKQRRGVFGISIFGLIITTIYLFVNTINPVTHKNLRYARLTLSIFYLIGLLIIETFLIFILVRVKYV